MTRKILILSSLFVGALALLRCDNGGFSRVFSRGDTNPSDGGPTIKGNTRIETWIQPDTSGKFPVDLIFVGDTSGSLNDEREDVTTALADFLSTIKTKGIKDYCVGVLFGHVGALSGKLQTASTVDDTCLCSDEYTDTQIVSKFNKNFNTELVEETASDGGEAMNYSFYKSFTNDKILNNNQDDGKGCYRRNAALAYIPVSDENDISTTPNVVANSVDNCPADKAWKFTPKGPAVEVDTNCYEAPARLKYYSDANGKLTLTPEKIVKAARTFQGSKLPFYTGAVVYTGEKVKIPSGGENEYGFGLVDVATLSGGDSVDLGLATEHRFSEFNKEFSNLAGKLVVALRVLHSFDLAEAACEDSVSVTVDGNDAEFSLSDDRRNVYVAEAGNPTDEVVITYKICP